MCTRSLNVSEFLSFKPLYICLYVFYLAPYKQKKMFSAINQQNVVMPLLNIAFGKITQGTM